VSLSGYLSVFSTRTAGPCFERAPGVWPSAAVAAAGPGLCKMDLYTTAAAALLVAAVQGSSQYTGFGISRPAPSADALPATLYGHSTWRPISRVQR